MLYTCLSVLACSNTFSTMDALIQTTMKGAVKCANHCDLQNSVNQWVVECVMCFGILPESMPSSAFLLCAANDLHLLCVLDGNDHCCLDLKGCLQTVCYLQRVCKLCPCFCGLASGLPLAENMMLGKQTC